MGNDLAVISACHAEGIFHSFIGHGTVAAVIGGPLIGGTHPGGAALGRTVQEDFQACQLQMVIVGELGQQGFRILVGVKACKQLHIHMKHILFQEKPIHGKHGLSHHAVLNGGDAVGGVLLLSILKGFQKLIRGSHGNLLHDGEEGVFLHIAGELSIDLFDHTAFRYRSIHRNFSQFQGLGVKKTHMAGFMMDNQRILRCKAIQLRKRGIFYIRHPIIIIVSCHHPLTGRNLIFLNKGLDSGLNFLWAGTAVQTCLQHGAGHLEKVTVGIYKRRKHGFPLQIAEFTVRCLGFHIRKRAYSQDFSVLCKDCFRIHLVFHGQDIAAVKNRFHKSTSFPVFLALVYPLIINAS